MQSKHLFALLCFVTFINIFFFRSIGSFGFQLFFIGAWTFLVVFGAIKGLLEERKTFVVASGATLFLFTLLTLLKANIVILSLIHLASFFVVLFTLYVFISIQPHMLALMEIMSVPLLVLKNYLGSVLKLLDGKIKVTSPTESVHSQTKNHDVFWQKIRPIVVGLLIGAPITFLLMALFAKADPVFESVIRSIVGQKFLENMLWRAVLSVIVFSIGLPILIMKRTQSFNNPINRVHKWGLITEYSIVMSLIAATIGLFVIIQWKYIFIPPVSGVNLVQFGVKTYSEYVNRGFNELLMATLFIFGLIWFGLILMRTKPDKDVLVLKSLQFTVLLEFVIVILSVLRRIWLYQHYHGMSLIRFYGGYFVIFVLFLTCTLFLRHLFRFRFAMVELIGGIVAIAGLALFNIESYIAVHHPPTVNERTDYVYLSRLSSDGYEGWLKSYNWSKEVLSKDYSGTITADQRREIAYAGITLEQIFSRYHELALSQGDSETIKNYYLTLHQESLKNIDESWKRLDELQPSIQVATDTGDVQSLKNLQYHRDQLSRLRTNVQTNIERLHEGNFAINPALIKMKTPINIYLTESKGKVQFTNTDCSYWDLCTALSFYNETYIPDSFFMIVLQSPTEYKNKKVPLDGLLTWNPTQELVFQSTQKDIPLADLLSLQKRYFELYRKISQQPDSEKDYDADISLNTPFLTPLSTEWWD